jgi:hypothetical protein
LATAYYAAYISLVKLGRLGHKLLYKNSRCMNSCNFTYCLLPHTMGCLAGGLKSAPLTGNRMTAYAYVYEPHPGTKCNPRDDVRNVLSVPTNAAQIVDLS